jgi:hypothetical protein
MVIVDESHKEEVETFLARFDVPGYTEIAHALGAGATGPRMGSRTFPKTSAVVFSLVDEAVLARLRPAISEMCRECGERVKMVVLGVEEVLT